MQGITTGANAASRSVDSKLNSGFRIVGGRPAKIEKIPFQVSLSINKKVECGGSILDDRHVLTAAHCVEGKGGFTVRSGSAKASKGGCEHRIEKTTIHPEYEEIKDGGLRNDIAILEVSPHFKFSETTRSIQLYKKSEEDISKYKGREVVISGFGALANQLKPHGELRSTTVNIVGSTINLYLPSEKINLNF